MGILLETIPPHVKSTEVNAESFHVAIENCHERSQSPAAIKDQERGCSSGDAVDKMKMLQDGSLYNSSDEDDLWLKSLVPHLRKLKDHEKLSFRTEVQRLLFRYVYAYQNEMQYYAQPYQRGFPPVDQDGPQYSNVRPMSPGTSQTSHPVRITVTTSQKPLQTPTGLSPVTVDDSPVLQPFTQLHTQKSL